MGYDTHTLKRPPQQTLRSLLRSWKRPFFSDALDWYTAAALQRNFRFDTVSEPGLAQLVAALQTLTGQKPVSFVTVHSRHFELDDVTRSFAEKRLCPLSVYIARLFAEKLRGSPFPVPLEVHQSLEAGLFSPLGVVLQRSFVQVSIAQLAEPAASLSEVYLGNVRACFYAAYSMFQPQEHLKLVADLLEGMQHCMLLGSDVADAQKWHIIL